MAKPGSSDTPQPHVFATVEPDPRLPHALRPDSAVCPAEAEEPLDPPWVTAAAAEETPEPELEPEGEAEPSPAAPEPRAPGALRLAALGAVSAPPPPASLLGDLEPPGPARAPAADTFYERIRKKGPVSARPARPEPLIEQGPQTQDDWRARVAFLRDVAVNACSGRGGYPLPEVEGRVPAPATATETLVQARVAARKAREATRESAAAGGGRRRGGPLSLLL